MILFIELLYIYVVLFCFIILFNLVILFDLNKSLVCNFFIERIVLIWLGFFGLLVIGLMGFIEIVFFE